MEKGANTRRRRLVERGSDRLAFITGQTRSLPSDPYPDSPLSGVDAASTQLSETDGGIGGEKFKDRTHLQKSEPSDLVPEFQRVDTREETKARALSYEDELFQKFKTGSAVPEIQPSDKARRETKSKTLSNEDELFQKFKTGSAVPEIQPSDKARRETKVKTLSNEDELFQKFKTGSAAPEIQPVNEAPLHRHDQETLSKKTSHDGASSVQPTREMEMRPRPAPPSQLNQADNAGWSMETLKEHLNFMPQEITKAISATESNRILASIFIAFLVVLSNWGLDIGGTITRILVGTRPLLFLILTNITIVLTLLMENKDPNVRGRPVGGSLGSADSLGQMLEIGLLVQKALGALLMDCSVCAVIMICFLGF